MENQNEAPYKNPWHRPMDPMYGPPMYKTSVTPTRYRGFLIYHRLECVWDVVKDGTCITQRAGFNGAKRAIDDICEEQGHDVCA